MYPLGKAVKRNEACIQCRSCSVSSHYDKALPGHKMISYYQNLFITHCCSFPDIPDLVACIGTKLVCLFTQCVAFTSTYLLVHIVTLADSRLEKRFCTDLHLSDLTDPNFWRVSGHWYFLAFYPWDENRFSVVSSVSGTKTIEWNHTLTVRCCRSNQVNHVRYWHFITFLAAKYRIRIIKFVNRNISCVSWQFLCKTHQRIAAYTWSWACVFRWTRELCWLELKLL